MDQLQFDDDFWELLRKAEETPDNSGLIAEVCYGLNIRSYHDLCIEYARKGLSRDPGNPNLYYELVIASSLDTANVLQEIREELMTLQRANPGQVGTLRNLALVHYFLESDSEANSILLSILDKYSGIEIDRQTYEVLAQLEYTRENMDQCIEYCDKAVDRPGPSARVIRLKGLCHQEMGDLDSATLCFRFALELEPNFVWACHSLAGLCMERGMYDQAFRFFGKAAYINPDDPGNQFLLAEAFMDMESYDIATAELQKLLLCKPKNRIEAEVYNALGYICLKTNDLEKAKEYLSQAIELEPELAVSYFNMGQVSREEGNAELGEHQFKLALEYDPLYVEAWIELGFLYFERKETENAEKCFLAALEIEATEAQALLGLSKLSQKSKDKENQLKYALLAAEYDPDHAEICNNLGIAHECNQQYEEAEEAYLSALELDPFHAQAANNLGYLYETKMKLWPENADQNQVKAIDAWTKRLQICVSRKTSTRSAVSHLIKLGLDREQIETLSLISYQP